MPQNHPIAKRALSAGEQAKFLVLTFGLGKVNVRTMAEMPKTGSQIIAVG